MAGFTRAKISLLVLSILAAYCIIGLQICNGFFDLLAKAGKEVPRKLLGSSENMIRTITGLPALDEHLGGLLMFFWPIVSGDSPSLSLFGVYMIGQLVAVQTLVLVEGLRVGNLGRIVSYTTLWGLLYQTVPWGIVMPIYFAIYLSTSPIPQAVTSRPSKEAASSLSIDANQLIILPVSLVLGFIVPTILAGIPSPFLTTVPQQQALLVLWQGYPMWISICQYILSRIFSVARSSTANAKSPQSEEVMFKHLWRVHTFSLFLTALAHWITLLFIASSSFQRSLGVNLRPGYFNSASKSTVNLESVFVPMSPLSTTKVELLTQGCLILLQYDMYFACGASLLWAAVMYHGVQAESTWRGTIVKVLFLSLSIGPAGAALGLIRDRDEKVFLAEKGFGSKERKAL